MRAFEQPSSPVCAETISRRTVLMRTIWTLRFFQKAGMWNFVFPSSPARLSTAQGAESFQGAWAEKLRIRTEPVSVPALILSAPSSGREGAGMGSPTLAEVCRLSSKRFWGKVSRKGGCEARGPECRAGKATLPPPHPTAGAVMPVGSVVKLRRQVLFL